MYNALFFPYPGYIKVRSQLEEQNLIVLFRCADAGGYNTLQKIFSTV